MVFHDPLNGPNACWSFANYPGYKIPVNSEGINMLTNKKSAIKFNVEIYEFTVKEFKV